VVSLTKTGRPIWRYSTVKKINVIWEVKKRPETNGVALPVLRIDVAGKMHGMDVGMAFVNPLNPKGPAQARGLPNLTD